ncbi:transcriptional regulator, IclR family [Pseudonocardia thermophila]|jgi:Transcriptional regulator|uniref:Transcriptional regulator, IclR family n=1 Tax=Pseudonocardia thermophila TaxID=1848 RepID=A0A1M6VHL3_PSETH|nr:IclR family transcriptional regulator [Pseudonocardia thermophila]SHK80861.1 transcriptional regulator, IclR family [Pseudonocardia thermophila]
MVEVQGAQAAYRLLDVLSELGIQAGGANLTSLSQALDLPLSTTRRLLRVLCDRGFAVQDEVTKLYELGPQARLLGTLRIDRRSLGELALPVLEELRETSGETVFLSVREGLEVTYVQCLRSPHPVQMYGEVGQRVPLHATSQGKAILAFLPAVLVERLLPRLDYIRYTPNTVTSMAELAADLEQVRKRRYALNFEEREPDVRSVATAILDPLGNAVAAVCIGAPKFRLDDHRAVDEFAPLLIKAAEKISSLLFPPVAMAPARRSRRT